MHTVVPPDDGPRYARTMQRLTKYTENKLRLYHPGLFTKLNNMVFISQTHLYFVLNALFEQHVSTRC
jgi:hypothetical protein